MAEEMVPGREVKLTGRVEDYDWSAQGPLLRLETQRVESAAGQQSSPAGGAERE